METQQRKMEATINNSDEKNGMTAGIKNITKIDDLSIKEQTEGSSTSTNNEDRDAQRLAELGYKQEFKREVTLFVQTGYTFSIMAVLPNWLIGFGGSMSAGGPMSLFWGLIVVIPFVMATGLAMAEQFSAYPVNGGVYSWCYLLSSNEWGPLMSWLCGYIFLAGTLTATMGAAYTMSRSVFDIINITVRANNPMDSAGARMGLYIAFLLLGVFYTCLGLRFNGYLNRFIVFWGAIGTLLVVIVVPSMAQTHPSARWVFTEFLNTTGYDNSGLTFMFALLQAGWSFVGYECGAQISEGTKNAASSGPRGIIIALSSAMVQALILCVSTLFSIQDVEELQNSSSPVATLFLRATHNERLSAFLLTILIVSQFGALCNVLLAGAQVMYAMARDRCLPNSKFWYKLNGKQQIPVRLLLLVACICITVLLPSLASDVYYEAIISTSVICLNVSYGLPAFCRLIWKRNDMPKGPFDLGKYSMPINIIAVVWVIFFGIILCIPNVHPITAETMNWSCLMLGVTVIFALTFWQISGRKIYKGPLQTITGEQ